MSNACFMIPCLHSFRRNCSIRQLFGLAVFFASVVAFGYQQAEAGILYTGPAAGYITVVNLPDYSNNHFPLDTSPHTNEFREFDVTASSPGLLPGETFTYSLSTGIYSHVGGNQVALVIPDGIFEVSTSQPSPGFFTNVTVTGEAGFIGDHLVTAGGMRIWGTIAPGDQVEYAFSGGTSSIVGSAGRTFSFSDTLTSPGQFLVQRSYISDTYATEPSGIVAKQTLFLSLSIIRGNSTEKTTIYIDPGVATYEAGTPPPDLPFLNNPNAVPEPGTCAIVGLGLAGILIARRKGAGLAVAKSHRPPVVR
jgi:hypothetical protein